MIPGSPLAPFMFELFSSCYFGVAMICSGTRTGRRVPKRDCVESNRFAGGIKQMDVCDVNEQIFLLQKINNNWLKAVSPHFYSHTGPPSIWS
jgi:hypothetical protein